MLNCHLMSSLINIMVFIDPLSPQDEGFTYSIDGLSLEAIAAGSSPSRMFFVPDSLSLS